MANGDFDRLDQVCAILNPLGFNPTLSGNRDVSVAIPDIRLRAGQTRPDRILRDTVFVEVQAAFMAAGINCARLPTTSYNEDAAAWRVDVRLLDEEDPYYYGDRLEGDDER